MTKVERDSWFNTGTLVVLVFVSLVWKGPTLKVRAVHAALLFAVFMLVRLAYGRLTRDKPEDIATETQE